MAFSTRKYVKHIDKYGVVHRLEIQEDGFGGSEDSIGTTGQVFQFEHETHAGEDKEILNVYENPVQKGSIELFLRIDNATDRTLISDIFNGDEDDFRLVWKRDGTTFWTGTILNDMLEYPESDYPYMAKLWAKDFSRLQGIDYALDDTRQTLITTFADLLGNLGYSLDIETHTSWTTSDTTDSTDFLQQIYHETKALRNFARTGDESDTTITVFEALEMMCRNLGLVCRQEGGVFKLIQYSEYETPSAVNVTVYDSTGTQKTAATSTDLSLDASSNDITITEASITRAFKAIRRARNKFNHRTKVSNIQFPDSFTLPSDDSTYSQFFQSDGNQVIKISGSIEATLPNGTEGTGTANIRVHPTGYWWDGDWQTSTSSFAANISLIGPDGSGNYVYQGNFSIVTDATPADADGTLEIEFFQAGAGVDTASETKYTIDNFEIENSVASENSTSIDYVLTQSGGYSSVFNFHDTWYGDGPIGYAPSALRHSSSDGDTTSDSWQRRGTTTGYRNFHENLLKEILDLQRGNRIKTDGRTLGADYDPEKIITYRSKSLAYTGGQFDGRGGDWKPVLFEINVVTGTDTFEDLPKFTDETGSGTGSSGGSSGGGLDQSTADARYLKLDASNDPVSGGIIFDIGTDEFRIRDGSAMFVVDGSTGQIGLGAEPLDDVGLLLDTPARAVTDNTDYDRLKVTNSGQLTIAASTTSPIVATAQFDEPNINLASGAAVTNAATVYIEDAPTEGDSNYALYAPSGASLLESLDINGNEFVDSSRNVSARNITAISSDTVPFTFRGTSSGIVELELENTAAASTSNELSLGFRLKTDVQERYGGFIRTKLTDIADTTGQGRMRFSVWNDGSNNTLFELEGNTATILGDASVDDTLTVNSQLLFTAGNEQLLSTDASPTFAGLTSTDDITVESDAFNGVNVQRSSSGNTGSFLSITKSRGSVVSPSAVESGDDLGYLYFRSHDGSSFGARATIFGEAIEDHSGSKTGTRLILERTKSGDTSRSTAMILGDTSRINDGLSIETSLTSGSVLTVGGTMDVKENLFVEGGLFAKEFTVDTTRVFLSSRFGSGGVVGEIVDSTVGSEQIKFVDQDGNAIVPFADNDLLLIQQRTGVNSGTIVKKIKRKVVADSQPSNVVSLTTSGVTTGTDVGTIAVGDQAVLDGNTTDTDRDSFIKVDVLDRDVAAFGFMEGVDDFGGGVETLRVGGMEPGGTNEYDPSITDKIGIAGKTASGDLGFVLTQGQFFYEGLGYTFSAYEDKPSASSGSQLGVLTQALRQQSFSNQNWNYVEASDSNVGTYDERFASFTTVYRHRFGYQSARVMVTAGYNNTTDNLNITFNNRIYVKFYSKEGGSDFETFVDVDTEPRSIQVIEFDLTQLTEGESYDVSVEPYADLEITTSNGNTQTIQTECGQTPFIEILGE